MELNLRRETNTFELGYLVPKPEADRIVSRAICEVASAQPTQETEARIAPMTSPPACAPAAGRTLFGRIAAMVPRSWAISRACVVEWRRRARSRGELMMLSDRYLSDIGTTRNAAREEANKHFWRQ